MTNELIKIAEEENILIVDFRLTDAPAITVVDEKQNCCIAIDKTKLTGEADEKVKLAHELGHCMCGAFYNEYSPLDLRARHECRADRWAFRKLVPRESLMNAVESGYTEMWQLAEYFDIPQDYMEKIACYYNDC